MDSREKVTTIIFYIVFLASVIIEAVFLFIIPYYNYSIILQCLKIIRILLGIINILIDLYLLVEKYAEYLIKKGEENSKDASFSSFRYKTIDKVLIIIASVISNFILSFNIAGIILGSKYLKRKDSSFMSNSLYIDSLFLLIENLLILLCWLYYSIFWLYNIKEFRKIKKIRDDKNIPKLNNAPPGPSQNQIPSSERQIT